MHKIFIDRTLSTKFGKRGYFWKWERLEWVGEKVGEKVGENLTQNQEVILSLIRENPGILARQLSDIIYFHKKGWRKYLKLKKKHLLKRIGPAKGGYWEILEKW